MILWDFQVPEEEVDRGAAWVCISGSLQMTLPCNIPRTEVTTCLTACPDPISGMFRYDPKDEIKTQTKSDAIQPCKLYFDDPGTRGRTRTAAGEDMRKKERSKVKKNPVGKEKKC